MPDRHPLKTLPTTAFSKATKTTALAPTTCLEWRHQNRSARTPWRVRWDRREQSWRPRRPPPPVTDPLWHRSRVVIHIVRPPRWEVTTKEEGGLLRNRRRLRCKLHTRPCRPKSTSAGERSNMTTTVGQSRPLNFSPAPFGCVHQGQEAMPSVHRHASAPYATPFPQILPLILPPPSAHLAALPVLKPPSNGKKTACVRKHRRQRRISSRLRSQLLEERGARLPAAPRKPSTVVQVVWAGGRRCLPGSVCSKISSFRWG